MSSSTIPSEARQKVLGPTSCRSGVHVVGVPPNDTRGNSSTPSKVRDFLRERDVASSLIKDLPEGLFSKIQNSVNCVLEQLHFYGLRKPSTCPDNTDYQRKYFRSVIKLTERIISHHRITGAFDSWIKFWKFKTSAFAAFWESQPIPHPPEGLEAEHPGYIFGGIIGQFIRCYNNTHVRSGLTLSILMVKKGMPRADEGLCREAEIECVKKLTTKRAQRKPKLTGTFCFNEQSRTIDREWALERERWIVGGCQGRLCRSRITVQQVRDLLKELDDPALSSLLLPKKKVSLIRKFHAKQQLRRTTRELFKGKAFGPREMSEPVFPSTSANYNNSRMKGGAVGHLKNSVIKDLFSVEIEDSFFQQHSFFYERKTEYHGSKGLEEVIDPLDEQRKIGYCFDPSELETAYRRFYWATYKVALDESPVVKPVALAEALKIRVISKGPPATYFVLKTFQKFLWKVLADHPTFRLIGRPVTVDDIIEICGDGGWYNSGDYQASTDNLYSWVSETILDELSSCLNLPPSLVMLSRRALTGHVFEDPSLPEGWALQQTGQLMGSIISFPFLCIANAAACRWAIEIAEKRSTTLRKAKLLVNGDDNLINSSSAEYNYVWERCCSVFGLDSSVGKTYFSQNFAVINSMWYDYTEDGWVERKYVNLGLVKGYQRSTAGPEEEKSILDVAEAYNALRESTPTDLWQKVKERFFYYNKRALEGFKGSYWLPRYAGGLGMISDELSYYDRQVLRIIQGQISEGYKPVRWPSKGEWDTWALAQDQLKKYCPLLHEHPYSKTYYGRPALLHRATVHDLREENQVVMKYMVIHALFNRSLKKLYPHEERDESERLNKVAKANSIYFQRAASKVIESTGAVDAKDVYVPDVETFLNVYLSDARN